MGVPRGTPGGERSGDDARFAQLYARCYGPVREYCSRRVSPDSVDDTVADTFLTVWRRLDDVPTREEEAVVWMYGVAFRMIGHQWRSAARRRRLQDRLRALDARAMDASDETAADGKGDHLVLAALARLGDIDAEVLRLVVWEQLSIAEVAGVVGIEPDTARQRLHRARRHLAREYTLLESRSTSTATAPTGGAQ